VLVIDVANHYYPQPENVLILPQKNWARNPYDTDLYDMVPIVTRIVELSLIEMDVRPIILRYDSVDPPRIVRKIMGTKNPRPDPVSQDYSLPLDENLNY